MNRIIAAALALTGLLVLAAPAPAASGPAAALKRELGPDARVAAHRETGKVRFVGTAAGRPIPRPAGVSASAAPREVARAFLGRHGKAFGIADAARELQVEASHTSRGRSSVRFQQLRGGIPVVGGELVVNLDRAGNVLSASGETSTGVTKRTPGVNSAAARQAAIAAIAKAERVSAARLQATAPELWIYDSRLLGGPAPQRSALVWRLEVKGGAGLAVNRLVLVDAQGGFVALTIDQVHEAKTQRICDANNTFGTGGTYPCTTPVVNDATGDTPQPGDDADVAPAYNFASDTYDFFFDRFGRDSLDDQGMPIVSTVDLCDVGPPPECPMENAFWDGEQMAYGDGFAGADDVVGHELTHGVTDFSAHLFYYYQSGAINESLSDVFGEYMDLTNGAGDDSAGVRWQMGEDLSIGAIRDMADPTAFNDPDSMTSPNYTADPNELDSGGVHTNSGVNNKAAYLIADGDTFGGQDVTGIGIDKAARVYYDVQTRYLTSGSDYADLASALSQSCADNVGGPEGITTADCTEVGQAVAAVRMSTDPPAAPAPEAPAATCASGQQTTPLFFDDMESFATPAGNSNWDTATGGWGAEASYAHSGIVNLAGVDPSTRQDTNVFMTRSVTIPADATAAYLRFDHAYGFDDDGSGAYDGGVLEYSTNNGSSYTDAGSLLTFNGYDGAITAGFVNPALNSPLVGRQAFIRESNGYISSLANLVSLKGRSVRFRFRIGSDASVADFGWFLDDVRILACTPPPPPVPPPGGGTPTTPTPTPTTPPTGGGTGSSPRLAAVKVRSCKVTGKGRRQRVRCILRNFTAVRRATVTVKKGRRTVAKKTLRPTSRGVLSVKPKRRLRRGRYKVTIVVRDAVGGKRTLRKTLRVR